MNSDEAELLEAVLDAFSERPTEVSEWQRGFLEDMGARYVKYGKETYVSIRQWVQIKKAAEKLGVEC